MALELKHLIRNTLRSGGSTIASQILMPSGTKSKNENLYVIFATPLIKFYEVVSRRLRKTALRSFCQVLSKRFDVERIESIVTISFRTFTGDKEFFPIPIRYYIMDYSCINFSFPQLFDFFGDVIF